MTKRLLTTATVALAAIAIAGGCGDSEEAPATISKAQYVKRADAICLKLNLETSDRYSVINLRKKLPTVAEQRETTQSVYLTNLEERLKKMEALPLPEQGQEELTEFLALLKRGIREAGEKEAIAFTNTSGFFRKANQLAEDIGFKYCYEV